MTVSKDNMRPCAYWARTCFGVDLDGQSVTIVKASRSRNTTEWAAVRHDDASFLAQAAAPEAVIAGCLRQRESFTRWIEAPFPSVSKAVQVFPSLLDIQLPFPLEDCVYVFAAAERTDRDTARGLAVAARASDAARCLELYRQRGLDPVLLDQEGLALWIRSIAENPQAADGARVVVCLGADRATIVIGQNGRFVGAHTAKKNCEDIARILHSVFSAPPAGLQWAWTGAGALDEQSLNDCRPALEERWPGDSFVHLSPETFLARAIALRAISAGPLRVNLRIGRYQHRLLARKAEEQSTRTALIMLAAGLLLCAANFAWGALVSRHVDNTRALFYSLAGDIGPKRGADAVEHMKESHKKRAQLTRSFVAPFEPSPAVTLASIVQLGKRYELTYQRVSLRENSIRIEGTANKWNQCEQLLSQLQREGLSLKLDRQQSSADGKIYFTVSPGGADG